MWSPFLTITCPQDLVRPTLAESHDIDVLVQAFQGAIHLKPFERGVSALIAILEQEVQKQKSLSVPFEDPGFEHEMSAFSKIFVTPIVLKMIGKENQELFSLPLIRRGNTSEELKHIERLCGKSEQEATSIAEGIIRDIESATKFPPEIHFESDVPGLLKAIQDLIRMFGGDPLSVGATAAPAPSSSRISEQDLPIDDLADLPDLEGLLASGLEEEEEEPDDDEEGDDTKV